MIKEIMENGIYKMIDGDDVILTIESLGDNVYKATNKNSIVIGKIVPLDEHKTQLTLTPRPNLHIRWLRTAWQLD